MRRTPIARFFNDFGSLYQYRDANAALGAPAPGERRVVFFGDSITALWNLDASFPGVGCIKRGIGGQTTEQMLLRFRPDVVDLRPALVLILAGTNDIAGNTGPMTLEHTTGNLATMAELAEVHGIRIALGSVTPVHHASFAAMRHFVLRPQKRILALNEWLRQYCAAHSLIYLDYFAAMADQRGLLRRELAEDGLHPNAAGYALMTPIAQAAIDRVLSEH
ncbi:MAG: GDSL-type esterase/lipase family protein [Terracidiphilus sp.]